MLDRLTGKPVHHFIHILACCTIAAGLPTSKIPLSLGTMLLALNLLLEGNFRQYGSNLVRTATAWPLWIFLGFGLLSLLWSSDMKYAMADLNIKLPLIIIPLVMVCKPVMEFRHFRLILVVFLAALFITSFVNVGSYKHWWGNRFYDDFRSLSLFGSHIRYALLIATGAAICIWWFIARQPYRFAAILPGAWFVWYLNFSQILSGHLVFGGVLLVLFLWILRTIRSQALQVTLVIAVAITGAGLITFIVSALIPVPHKMTLENLPEFTANGNPYTPPGDTVIWENGYPVGALICEKELEPAWNAASEIDYKTGLDSKFRPVSYTLWLYMTSKGLRKDSLGFAAMTRKDVNNVERGYTSVLLVKPGFRTRLYEVRHELQYPEDPNGHTLLQRIEYWKAGWNLAGRHLLFGTGTGDVDREFSAYYKETGSRLLPELQRRSHNQFLTVTISTGIVGLLAFLALWLLFIRKAWLEREFLSLSFIAICLFSFLVEDTLETQVGVTFVAFFYGLFITRKPFHGRS